MNGEWFSEHSSPVGLGEGLVATQSIPLADVAEVRVGMGSAGWRTLLESLPEFASAYTNVSSGSISTGEGSSKLERVCNLIARNAMEEVLAAKKGVFARTPSRLTRGDGGTRTTTAGTAGGLTTLELPIENDMAFSIVTSGGCLDLCMSITKLPALPPTMSSARGTRGPAIVRD